MIIIVLESTKINKICFFVSWMDRWTGRDWWTTYCFSQYVWKKGRSTVSWWTKPWWWEKEAKRCHFSGLSISDLTLSGNKSTCSCLLYEHEWHDTCKMLWSRLKMIHLYFAEGLWRRYCRITWALTTQDIWRKAKPWLVCATIVQVGRGSTQSERSAGKGLTSREATGRPTAADR